MLTRLITPSQLSLFSISPVIGAWWEELQARKLFERSKPEPNELEKQLRSDGERHEEDLLERLEAKGHGVVRLLGKQSDADYDATQDAMRRGVEYIHQASLRNNAMRGSADLLKRIDQPSLLGKWSYIPIECKLASKPKTTFLVQALAYCELLTPHLGNRPEQFELYLGGGTFKEFRTKDFWAWYQQLRDRYEGFLETFDPQAIPEDERGDHGSWSAFIDERLVEQRDLILVADIRESQRQKLRAAGISSIDQLANSPRNTEIPQLDPRIFKQLQEQAPFVSFGTTALMWSQHIDAVASELWPAGYANPCFNSVTVLVAVCRAGREDPGRMPCNAVPAGSAAPPRI